MVAGFVWLLTVMPFDTWKYVHAIVISLERPLLSAGSSDAAWITVMHFTVGYERHKKKISDGIPLRVIGLHRGETNISNGIDYSYVIGLPYGPPSQTPGFIREEMEKSSPPTPAGCHCCTCTGSLRFKSGLSLRAITVPQAQQWEST